MQQKAQNGRSSIERVYDRVAWVYDWYEGPMDRMGGRARRERIISGAQGRVLEVGVGTGRNFQLYSPNVALTGIDISTRMLERARRRAGELGRAVDLQRADVQALPFPDQAFDAVTATCVFCSVEDPIRGLEEVRRVLKRDGVARLLEHVRPRNAVLGRLFDWITPLTRWLLGPEMNRRTEEAVRAAGLQITEIRREGIFREIVATPAHSAGETGPKRRDRRRPEELRRT